MRTASIRGPVDARAAREPAGLSQAEFARRYGFSERTLQEWERGRAETDSAAQACLIVIARNRKAAEKALAGK